MSDIFPSTSQGAAVYRGAFSVYFTAILTLMRKWVVLNKEVGQTPLDAVEQFREWSPGYKDLKMAYAGRLDPMASGKLLVLIGEECKEQEKYQKLDKEYEVEIVIGASSDSGDVLGLVAACDLPELKRKDIIHAIKSFKGKFHYPYPTFSSKTVNGKPLHEWTMEGRLDEIEIPYQNGEILKVSIIKNYQLTNTELHEQALAKVHSIPEVTDPRKAVGKNFRRMPIKESWDTLLTDGPEAYQVIKIRCVTRSGTYMRSLAEEIGKKLGTCAFAFSIHRTKIGKYRHWPLGLSHWGKKY